MKRLIAASMMALVFVAGVADAKSRGGSSSSRSFSRPSVGKTVASKPAPKLNLYKPSAPVSKPKAFVSSKPSGTTVFKQAPARKMVVSKPNSTRVVKAPVRKITSPIQYKKTVIVKRTVYRPRYGYNRYYGGGYNNYGGYGGYGYNSSSGFGSSLMGGVLGAMAGMYLYDSLNGDSPTDEECAKDENGACLQQPQAVESQAPQEQQGVGLGGMLPPDAPLMMSPSYYNQQ